MTLPDQHYFYCMTGGNEQDLLPLAEIIDKDANVLSVRGNVLEKWDAKILQAACRRSIR